MTSTDRQFSAGTIDDSAVQTLLFQPEGKKSGHGAIAWLPAPLYAVTAPPSWPPGPGRHPVIALLDSRVDDQHPWLPQSGSPPFVTHPKNQQGWSPVQPDDEPADESGLNLGSHLIHGTFIAGLIRQYAADARIVNLPVMNHLGKVDPTDVIVALTWLADHAEDTPVDIVLMAFGAPADPSEPDLAELKKAMSRLGAVQFVVSAGNDGSDRTVYPAAFSVAEDLNVTSVGAISVDTPTERAPYSNYGPWVQEWRKGTNILSIASLTTVDLDHEPDLGREGDGTRSATGYGYAWWSGTSFAAALYAADLANQMSATGSYPEPAAGS
jgi:hypothetical protein